MTRQTINARGMLTVRFTDGEVKEYPVSAHKGIAAKLGEVTGRTGILSIWNEARTFGIPVAQIKEFSMRDVDLDEAAEIEREQGAVYDLPEFIKASA